MKALVCERFGPVDDLRLTDLPAPQAAPGHVVIEVHAASVNYPDGLLIQGRYQARPELPFIPGCEVAGVVSSVGEGITAVRPGERVLAACGLGGFAEQVAAPAQAVFPIGNEVDFASAAALSLTYATTYHALRDRARLQPDELLLVLGAGGGVGTAAVELGKLLGARVIAAASSAAKLDAAQSRGADFLINYASEDLRARLKEITAGEGVDVVYDPVGGAYAEPAFRAIGWEGRYLVIGFASGEIPKLPLNLPLLKGSSIVGVFWGEYRRRHPQAARKLLEQLVAWLRAEELRPLVSERFPLRDAVAAIQCVIERRALGKVVIEMGS